MDVDRASSSNCAVEELIAQLTDPDRAVRRQAAIRLGQAKDSRAVPALIALLQDCDDVSSPAQYAAWALGEIGDRRAIEPLLAAVREKYVGDAAIAALLKLREERVLEPIIDIYRETSRPDFATILGNLGDRRAVEPLIAAMQSSDAHVRYYAARALGKIGDDRALAVLEWAEANDLTPIQDTRSLRGKSVSAAAAKAIAAIKAR